MNYVLIGKLVNTHGIKGEVRIISDFKYKSRVFLSGVKLFIGDEKEKVTIKTYRPHKNFDMCMFEEYGYINDVLKFKGKKVYVDRDILNMRNGEYLDSDLINLEVLYNDKIIGKIEKIINNNGYKLLFINGKYIPYNNEFIEEVNLEKKQIKLKNLEGLL